MGEVYRAKDTRLGREVAIKVLPSHLIDDPDVKARFEREAKAISQLTHPHICTLYDVGSEAGVEYLVMELLEGRTLADRIDDGPLPIDQALRYGVEIADALDRAHRAGIVHRDLKPGNVMLTKSGVKLLDFGLAKAAAQKAVVEEASSLPTQTERPLTEKGTILGTFQYMAPEQLEGADADARTDIFALGCVLYEMATGKKAFTGKSRMSLIGAILKDEPPPVSTAAPMSPPALDRLVRTCMAKDPDDRFQTAHDVGLQLRWIAEGGSQAGAPAVVVAHRKSREKLAWTAAAAAVAASVALGIGFLRRAPKSAPPVVSEIGPPPGATFSLAGDYSGAPVLSPDGAQLAFAALTNGKRELWVRPLASPSARALPGTDDATFPFWSPDGRSLAFFAGGKLQRIDVAGGPPLPIADAPGGRGGAWGPDGTILFAPVIATGIFRVPASGGTPQPVTKPDPSRQESTHRWPQFLPDGEHFLYYVGGGAQSSGTWVGSLRGGPATLVLRGDSSALYAPPGWLLFVRGGTLMAQRFDEGKRRLSGDAAPVAERADADLAIWRGVFTASDNGVLAFEAAGSAVGHDYRLLWYDRSGKKIGETGEIADYDSPQLSPDGARLAVSITDPVTGEKDIWIFDLARGVKSRFTFAPPINSSPSWSPDGKTITFLSNRGGQFHLYQKSADGSGHAIPLLVDDAAEFRPVASPDGKYVLFDRGSSKAGSHLECWALPLFGDRKPFPVLQNPKFNQGRGSVSPNGRWLAYMSPESGRPEIFVVPFLRAGGKWQVSTAGGTWPAWRGDGRELYYLATDGKLMAAGISERADGIAIGGVSALFPLNSPSVPGRSFDAAADGQKFVVIDQGEQHAAVPVTLVTNWPALLKQR